MTADPQDKGLGLGLSIVQRSAQVLGHALNVRSEPGRGSTFEIVVPYTGSLLRRIEADGSSDDPPVDEVVGGAFVVIVDDDEGNRHALEATCAQWGCHVLSAASADGAASELSQHLRSPDLIVSDLELGPDGDGFAAIERIRRHCGEPIPAVIVTASLDGRWAASAAAFGVRLLHKPVNAARLLATFKAAIEEARAHATPPAA
jgi:CheY-like chemotaxis protein